MATTLRTLASIDLSGKPSIAVKLKKSAVDIILDFVSSRIDMSKVDLTKFHQAIDYSGTTTWPSAISKAEIRNNEIVLIADSRRPSTGLTSINVGTISGKLLMTYVVDKLYWDHTLFQAIGKAFGCEDKIKVTKRISMLVKKYKTTRGKSILNQGELANKVAIVIKGQAEISYKKCGILEKISDIEQNSNMSSRNKLEIFLKGKNSLPTIKLKQKSYLDKSNSNNASINNSIHESKNGKIPSRLLLISSGDVAGVEAYLKMSKYIASVYAVSETLEYCTLNIFDLQQVNKLLKAQNLTTFPTFCQAKLSILQNRISFLTPKPHDSPYLDRPQVKNYFSKARLYIDHHNRPPSQQPAAYSGRPRRRSDIARPSDAGDYCAAMHKSIARLKRKVNAYDKLVIESCSVD